MTDDGGGLLWKNQSWANFLNSDNSGAGGVDEKSGKKLLDSSTSNNQTPSGNEAVVAGGKKGSSSDLEGKKKNNKNGKGIIINEGKGGGGGGVRGSDQSSDHEIHIWTERERRKKMRSMFSNLHALLPQLPRKADKSTIVDEAVNYIKTLQHTLQKLQKQKLEKLHGVATMNYDLPSLVTPPKLAMDTREAFVADQISSNTNSMPITSTNSSISSPQFPPIFQSWNSKNLILNVCGLDAQFCVCSPKKSGLLTGICFVSEKYKLEVVSAQVSSDNCKSMYMIHTHACCLDFLEVVPVEDIYKQAAGEIIFFINSK